MSRARKPSASLTADLVHLPRASDADDHDWQKSEAGWREDAKLFGFTWLGGFVFFFAFLS